MKVKIFGEASNTAELLKKCKSCLEELGLSDFIKIEETNDSKLKEKLNITKEPALIIEEEEIDFLDTIFEGIVPEEEEIKSMFVSIIGGGEGGGCDTGGCGSCSSGGCG